MKAKRIAGSPRPGSVEEYEERQIARALAFSVARRAQGRLGYDTQVFDAGTPAENRAAAEAAAPALAPCMLYAITPDRLTIPMRAVLKPDLGLKRHD